VKIFLRGPRIQVELDDHLIFDHTDETNQSGSVNLKCYNSDGRFRDIKVTAPNGDVLWEGPPDLP
jgi:eukaryotic-like serine/threonine-protein kinase